MVATSSRIVHGAGVALRVFEHGPTGGPTLVLVHGYPDTSALWTPMVARLGVEHHVVTYDVRGAGRSEAPPGTDRYRLELLIADLRAVVDAVSPDAPVHLVGHDWGAIEGFAAVQDPVASVRIASFTAICAPGLDVVGDRIVRAWRSRRPTQLWRLARQLARSWYVLAFQAPLLPRVLWRGLLGRLWPRLRADLHGPGHPAPTLVDDAVTGVARYRANREPVRAGARVAPRLRVPVRVVAGAHDAYVTPWVFDHVAELGDDVRVEVVAGGHWLPRTHPELLAQRIATTVVDLTDATRRSSAPVAPARTPDG